VDQEDERLKELFGEVGGQQGPPLGFSAAGIARRGKRIRFVRRAGAAAAGLAVAAVVTVSVALAANREVEPGTPPTPPTLTTTDDLSTTPEYLTTTTTTMTTTTPPNTDTAVPTA
jgi:hypothetical protein